MASQAALGPIRCYRAPRFTGSYGWCDSFLLRRLIAFTVFVGPPGQHHCRHLFSVICRQPVANVLVLALSSSIRNRWLFISHYLQAAEIVSMVVTDVLLKLPACARLLVVSERQHGSADTISLYEGFWQS